MKDSISNEGRVENCQKLVMIFENGTFISLAIK